MEMDMEKGRLDAGKGDGEGKGNVKDKGKEW